MPFKIAPIIILLLPLVEIATFIVVGSHIGVLPTIGLTIATTLLGGVLLRVQGFGVLTRIRATMDKGGTPGRELVHGVMIMLAGLLLLVPGFVTDLIGLLLFIPPVRELAWRFLKDRIVVVSTVGTGARWNPRRPNTIDLDEDEYRADPRPADPSRRLDDDR